ncbi:MAG: hypothetical protein GXY49_04115 [Syntrophomonadaceae bacterium]|jgi:hypothetical protein|nr:hypothetical protein [Syntrophomonadaceae bacterium]
MNNNARYSKAQWKKLKELAGEVYKIELDAELDKLFDVFQSWKSGKVDCWDVEEAIHKFHQGPSRKLYNRHNNADADIIVAWALKGGILPADKVPEDLLEEIKHIMAIYD